MPFNGSGVFQRVRNWVADATAGVKIRADFHDSEDDNLAAGLTNCITKDGQTTITQNIPMNNKRLTGLQDPVNAQDAATKASSEAYANNKLITVPAPVNPGDATNKTYVDAGDAAAAASANSRVLKTGDTMTGDLTVHRNNNQGYVWLGNTAAHYVGFDGANYVMASGHLFTNAGRVWGTSDFNYVPQAPLGFTPVQQNGGTGMAGNKVYIGWDGSGLRAQVDNNDSFGYLLLSNNSSVRLVFAADADFPFNGTTMEPYGGAVITGIRSWFPAGQYITVGARWRYLQLRHPGGWLTVGYAAS